MEYLNVQACIFLICGLEMQTQRHKHQYPAHEIHMYIHTNISQPQVVWLYTWTPCGRSSQSSNTPTSKHSKETDTLLSSRSHAGKTHIHIHMLHESPQLSTNTFKRHHYSAVETHSTYLVTRGDDWEIHI